MSLRPSQRNAVIVLTCITAFLTISLSIYTAHEVADRDNAAMVATGASVAVLAALYGILLVFTYWHAKGLLAPGYTAPRLPLVLMMKSSGVTVALFGTYAHGNVGALILATIAAAVCGGVVGYRCQPFWSVRDTP